MRYHSSFLIIIAFTTGFIWSQDRHEKLSFELEYGISKYSMNKINRFYIDSVTSQSNPSILKDKIRNGQKFSLSISYRPNRKVNFGLFTTYQYGEQYNRWTFEETDNAGYPIKNHFVDFNLKTQSLSCGIVSIVYLSEYITKIYQSKRTELQNLRFGLGFKGGVGVYRSVTSSSSTTINSFNYYDFFESIDFYGETFLDVGYYLTSNEIFSLLGIRLGYQFAQSSTLQDRNGNDWVVKGEYPINLNFSGLFISTYLNIGR